MATVLSADAQIACPHQGPITAVATQAVLKVKGRPVLLADDVKGAAVVCPNKPPAPVCSVTIATLSPAVVSTVLKVDGKPVALDSGVDPANTTSAGPFTIDKPGQNVLRAK